jgi:ABC-type phosphate transport system substrate-binding protein
MKKSGFAVFAIFLALLAVSAHAQLVVIAHPGVEGNAISKASLSKVFTGASSRLGSGAHVVPVLLKEGNTHNRFLSEYLGKSPIALLLVWRGLVLSGQAAMPKSVESEEEMVKFVARTPNSIGYIDAKTPHAAVKEIQVE